MARQERFHGATRTRSVHRRRNQVWIIGMLVLALNLMSVSRVAGQSPWGVPTRSPAALSSPSTLSPYLDLLRNDDSELSPYHSFVRPKLQLRENLARQAFQIGQLRRQETADRNAIAAPTRLPTGRGGSFNNHLHFYPAPPSSSPR